MTIHNLRCRKTLLMFANVYLSKVVNFGYIPIGYLDFFFILAKINLGCNLWVGKNFQVSAILLLNSIHWQPERHNWFQIISEGVSLVFVYPCTVNSWFKKVRFSFLKSRVFDLRKIYVMNLKTSLPKKMPYLGEFATWDLS